MKTLNNDNQVLISIIADFSNKNKLMHDTLLAIKARIEGDWEHPALVAKGFLKCDGPAGARDILDYIDETLMLVS